VDSRNNRCFEQNARRNSGDSGMLARQLPLAMLEVTVMRCLLHSAVLIGILSCSLHAQGDRLSAGAEITVRTREAVDSRYPSDNRVYFATVDRDVRDRDGRTVIPRGSEAELILRDGSASEIVLDLESVTVNGRRYTVDTLSQTVSGDGSRRQGVGANQRTGKYVGGGAILGTIIGAIAGGGKGAAIGAAAGAGAGAVGQTATRGGAVRLPPESLITFRLERPLVVGPPDDGYTRDGRHYHRYDDDRRR
jgi:hypothetical protein